MEARTLLSAVGGWHRTAPAAAAAWHVSATATATIRPVGVAVYVGGDAATPTAAGKKSAAKRAGHRVTVSAGATVAPSALPGGTTPTGLTPAQVRAAYGLGTPGGGISYPVAFGGIAGDGAGQTIAIVVAYDDPYAVSDLHGFSQYYGLPDAPSFVKLNQRGGTALPAADPGIGWSEEASLDFEWSHAMAPRANLILYEADSDDSYDVYTAVATAAANPAVTVINMSFGGGEDPSEVSDDAAYFVTPAAHAAGGTGTGTAGGVTFVAATGDGGAGVESPSSSPHVVAVGGTSLYLNGDYSYSLENAWSGSGGGVSAYEPRPAYQAGTTAAFSTTNRSVPDVAMVGNPGTGVSIYDSYDFGATTPWLGGGYRYGGTSLSSPLFAGVVAVADQGRAAAGLPSLDSADAAAGTVARLYQLPASDFHDVTIGSNGYAAGAGYDLVTGRGSAVANTLIGDLAGSASVAGRAYVDANGSGAYDAGVDAPSSGVTVYLDYNNDGLRDNNEPAATTTAAGTYAFADVPAGGTVRAIAAPAGTVAVPSGTSAAIAYGTGQTTDFAFFRTAYAAANNGDQLTLRTDATGTVEQVLLNGVVTDSISVATLTAALGSTPLSFTLTGTGAGLTVTAANGNPLPTGGLSVTGTAGAGDTLAVVGTAGDDAIAVAAGSVTFGTRAITTADLAGVSVDPGAGTDTLSVAAGAAATVPATASGLHVRRFASVSVASGGTLAFATAAAHADRAAVVASSVSVVGGTLDLGGNDLVVRNGDMAAVTALVRTGFANGRWTGAGLTSAAAAADGSRLTTLGVAVPLSPTFDGLAVTAADVVVKFTYYGDANLDGVVNAADYTRVDVGFVTGGTGWSNGDFNYDGVVDGSDYALIDNAFNTEGGGL